MTPRKGPKRWAWILVLLLLAAAAVLALLYLEGARDDGGFYGPEGYTVR